MAFFFLVMISSTKVCYKFYRYFEEGMKTWAHFGTYVTELSEKLRDVRHRQEEERRRLLATRKIISSSLSAEAKTEVSDIFFLKFVPC